MKRRSIWATAGLALAAFLLFAAPAMAAPTLGVEVTRSPATINRGDEFVSYKVKVQNTAAVDPTSGTLTVAIGLPPGLTLKRAAGTGWTCSVALLSCTSSTSVAAAGTYPELKLEEIWIDESAPDTVVVTATASGGGASGSAVGEDSFGFGPGVPFGLEITDAIAESELGGDETQAGGHPLSASAIFRITQRKGPGLTSGGEQMVFPVEDLHGGISELPAGIVGNPQAAEAVCEFADLKAGDCPDAAAVGGVKVYFKLNLGEPPGFNAPPEDIVYRLPPEKGYPASFGFDTIGPSFVVRTKVRSDGDYGISAVIPLVPQAPAVYGAEFGFCGFGPKVGIGAHGLLFQGCKKRVEPASNPNAFITNGTDCAAGQPLTRFGIDSWQHPGAYADNELPDLSDPNWSVLDFHSPALTGCETLTEEWTGAHEPSFSFQPDGHAADSPAAYTARLHVPQGGLVDPYGLGTSHLKDTTVTLPVGLSFNPAIGNRLEGCSTTQIGLIGTGFPAPNRIHFDTKLPHCPEASKIGTVSLGTPLLEDTLHGSVFLASQKDNPFHSDYAIYISIEEPEIGVVAKLPGKITLDPSNGQISAVFADNPQLPFEDLELKFFGGDRSALANPVTCGAFGIKTQLTPWSAEDPEMPRPDEIATPSDQISISAGPNGAPCVSNPAQRPFGIGLSAGAKDPIAGAKSPFSIRVTRPDGSQELDRLEISPPPGFVASLKGIPYCSEAQIVAATSNSGKVEQASSSCPSASQVGTTNSGAGPGATPFYAPGKLFLAGPYKGQALSVVAITPAVAGPYDLGNVVIRSALKIDPRTARITAITDTIPQIFEGIPLRIRDIRINLDRPSWAINPTNCEAMSVDVTAFGSSGAVANPSNRFQVGNCDALGFKPELSIRLKGGAKRGDYPALLAKLTTRPGDANIARAAVTLPHSAFLAQEHIGTICTRVQFAARACPAGAIYGFASASTPLLDDPIQGNVLLRSSDNRLPDLVADLRGVANVEAVGRVDSVNGGIRNTFDIIPDAPFEVFTLKMQGGSKGLVINSRDLCKGKPQRATVRLTAQNGKVRNFRPVVVAEGCSKKDKPRRAKHGARARLGDFVAIW